MRFYVALLSLVVGCSTVAGRHPRPDRDSERHQAHSWFDGLGFPDLRELPYVEVATRWWTEPAFLVDDSGSHFTILTWDLAVRTFRRPAGSGDHGRASYRIRPLEEEAEKLLRELRRETTDRVRARVRSVPCLPPCSRTFVVAQACDRSGLEGLSSELFEQATRRKRAFRQVEFARDRDRVRSTREILAVEIGHVVFWRSILEFENEEVDRRHLLDLFERFAERFPESRHAGDAEKLAAALASMVREDEQAGDRPPLATLTREERVAELVYRLRDQTCSVSRRPGSCDIFSVSGPAAELAALGYDAFPQLVEALDDERPTRALSSYRDHVYSHRVMTIGDCAHEILERTAGVRFYRGFIEGDDQFTCESEKRNEAIRTWWTQVQQKGEEQLLIERTLAGNETSGYYARQLAAENPAAAKDAILGGMQAADTARVRSDLVRLLGYIQAVDVTEALLRETREGPCPASRLAAAEGLLDVLPQAAVEAMASEWERLTDAIPEDDLAVGTEKSLIEFLVRSGSPAAIASLARGLERRPIRVRQLIIEELGDALSGPVTAVTDRARSDMEDLLIPLLEDHEETAWVGGGVIHPRIRDLAARTLAENWAKYSFSIASSLRLRDRMIVQLANVWRKEHALAPLQVPAKPDLTSLARGLTRTVLDVSFDAELPPGEHKIRDAIGTLEGEPLTTAGIGKILTMLPRALSRGVPGIQLDLNGDTHGVVVSVRSVGPMKRQLPSRDSWAYDAAYSSAFGDFTTSSTVATEDVAATALVEVLDVIKMGLTYDWAFAARIRAARIE